MKILIDNGHGADTAGKCSPDGSLREWSYAREIAARVVSELKRKGLEAALLVPESHDVSLYARASRVNKVCAAGPALLVSIHVNAAGNGRQWMSARGWSAYTSPGQTEADRLATCLYAAAEQHLKGHRLRRDLSDGDADQESNFYLLRRTRCPAVLTENLFQDNRQDVAFLLSDAGKTALVSLHVEGIMEYVGKL